MNAPSTIGLCLPPVDVRHAVARALWQAGAVNIAAPDAMFTLTSGALSPAYVDVRCVIGHLDLRRLLTDAAHAHLVGHAPPADIDVVAGGETAGIPFAAWVSDAMHRPMVYIRKADKAFGRKARIEGAFAPKARTLLVEDMVTDGGSKLGFVQSIREAGGTCGWCLVFFAYGAASALALQRIDVRLLALCAWEDLLHVGVQDQALTEAACVRIRDHLRAQGWL